MDAELSADSNWSEARFRRRVDAVVAEGQGAAPELLALLDERCPAYAGRGAGAVVRMRSHALLALTLMHDGSSPWHQALPFVLEELQSGRAPVLMAAAARVLPSVAVVPDPAFATCLVSALITLRQHDDAVDLAVYGGTPIGEADVTALDEVLHCLQWLGDAASGIRLSLIQLANEPGGLSDAQRQKLQQIIDTLHIGPLAGQPHQQEASAAGEWLNCCNWSRPNRQFGDRSDQFSSAEALATVQFEDQDQHPLSWRDCLIGQHTVVVFFYTRCDNAMKCSLSISKLARVQKLLRQTTWGSNIRTVAITYDPDFDLPHRLRGYVESRGMVLDDTHRVLRVTAGREVVDAFFDLGVSFVASLVNRHRIEAFLLDADGQLAKAYRRMAWQEQDVVDDLHALMLTPQTTKPAATERITGGVSGLSPLWALALALFPKCPICGAGYLSLTGLVALPQIPGWYWTWPLFALALLLNLGVMAWQARIHKRWTGLGLSGAGAIVLLGLGVARDSPLASTVGVLLSAMGALYSTRAFSVQSFKRPFQLNGS